MIFTEIIFQGKRRLLLTILSMLPMVLVSGCSTYKSSFGCGDAKGAECYAMDRVDRMIASGEIEIFNEARYRQNNGRCQGGNCRRSVFSRESKDGDNIYKPEHKIKLSESSLVITHDNVSDSKGRG